MAKVKNSPRPSLADRVVTALKAGLKTSGFAVEGVEIEPIKGTRLFRVTVVARGFDKIWVTERQDLVWRILDQSLSPEEQLRISMVVTLSPSEVVGV
jgi:hypothetical protein